MNIPFGTSVEIKATGHKACLVYRHEPEESCLCPLYTLEFEDGTEVELHEDEFSTPEHCGCGNRMEEVTFIPGTETCFSCHELLVMDKTGIGVVLVDELGRPYMTDVPNFSEVADTKSSRFSDLDNEIPF